MIINEILEIITAETRDSFTFRVFLSERTNENINKDNCDDIKFNAIQKIVINHSEKCFSHFSPKGELHPLAWFSWRLFPTNEIGIAGTFSKSGFIYHYIDIEKLLKNYNNKIINFILKQNTEFNINRNILNKYEIQKFLKENNYGIEAIKDEILNIDNTNTIRRVEIKNAQQPDFPIKLYSLKQQTNFDYSTEGTVYEINFDSNKSIFFEGFNFLKKLQNITYSEFNKIVRANNLTIFQIFNFIYYLPKLQINNKTLNNTNTVFILTTTENLTKNFNNVHYFQNEIIETLQNNYGNENIKRVIEVNGKSLESQFTDFQAFHICKGIKNKSHLFDRYSNNTNNKQHDFDAHDIAMRTLQKNGKPIIDFILSLPSTPFKCENFKLLFSSLDRQINNENPIVRLKLKNIKGKTEEIEYCFIIENGTKYKNQVRIKNKTTNTNLFEVSRDGFVICEENIGILGVNRNITPVIQLFYRVTENEEKLKNAILTYGMESGKCSICGRELTNQISKIKGIGPVCETYL
ncbi:DUF6011 domain-containing protein [Chryseobacterium sp. MP_3.2]|uniref:DUF6011 domain-containing protein n=1 Tax=Chryseobacterium sp. MP_3.2 TaxID=3071712 RepID=UPI002DFDC074|nr:regulator of replication initiation timing [Chryseobacterium sp. MP_3.2]